MNDAKTWVEISRGALQRNAKAIQKLIAPSGLIAVVKSNAYGHGLKETVMALQKMVSWYAVDSIDEALVIRKANTRANILVLGYIPLTRLRLCATHRISFVAYDASVLRWLEKTKGVAGSYRLHLKVETGTSRQGIHGKELIAFARALSRLPHVRIEGAYTHYANIEDTTDASYAMDQLSRFREAIQSLRAEGIDPTILHTASSAASILYPETRFDLARLGIAVYGHWPSKEAQAVAKQKKAALTLEPALTWKTVVAQVKAIPRNTPVSYGLTERVSRPSRIAILPVGYWDGYDRGLSSIGHVLVRGKRCKVLGRICMNMTIVDVTDVQGVKTGDEVVLIGKQKKEQINAEDVASKIGSIQYELLTRINPTIKRILVS